MLQLDSRTPFRFRARPSSALEFLDVKLNMRLKFFLEIALRLLPAEEPRSKRPQICNYGSFEFVPDHLSLLHHELNALEFANVGDGISGDANQISKLSWLDRADAVLLILLNILCRIRGDRANHIEKAAFQRRARFDERLSARLPARLSRIKTTHIRASGKLDARLQHWLEPIGS